jgi:hypothetical protein
MNKIMEGCTGQTNVDEEIKGISGRKKLKEVDEGGRSRKMQKEA